jgi:dTDP-4-dehydrorhamnose 3,5-epimerase-like enzyme
MDIRKLEIQKDIRGSFIDLWNSEKGINKVFLSIFEKGTLSGIHCSSFDRIIKCINGFVFCALVDLRPESKDFRKSFTCVLDINNIIKIPSGFGYGVYMYKDSTLLYLHEMDDNKSYIHYNCFSPEFNISWPIENSKGTTWSFEIPLLMSEHDKK